MDVIAQFQVPRSEISTSGTGRDRAWVYQGAGDIKTSPISRVTNLDTISFPIDYISRGVCSPLRIRANLLGFKQSSLDHTEQVLRDSPLSTFR